MTWCTRCEASTAGSADVERFLCNHCWRLVSDRTRRRWHIAASRLLMAQQARWSTRRREPLVAEAIDAMIAVKNEARGQFQFTGAA
jgi:hypothetical protein